MKKLFIFLFIFLCGCSKSNLSEISYKNLYDKMNGYDSYIIYFCGTDSKCDSSDKILNDIVKEEKIKIYYLNTSNIVDKEKMIIETIYFNGSQLVEPSLLKVENGIIRNSKYSITDYNEIKDFLKEK